MNYDFDQIKDITKEQLILIKVKYKLDLHVNIIQKVIEIFNEIIQIIPWFMKEREDPWSKFNPKMIKIQKNKVIDLFTPSIITSYFL